MKDVTAEMTTKEMVVQLKEVGKEMSRKLENFGKEGKSRKTTKRLDKVEKEANECWTRFTHWKQKIMESGEVSTVKETQEYFGFVERVFNQLIENVNAHRTVVAAESESSLAPSQASDQVPSELKMRDNALKALQAFLLVYQNFEEYGYKLNDLKRLEQDLILKFQEFEVLNSQFTEGAGCEDFIIEFEEYKLQSEALIDRMLIAISECGDKQQVSHAPQNMQSPPISLADQVTQRAQGSSAPQRGVAFVERQGTQVGNVTATQVPMSVHTETDPLTQQAQSAPPAEPLAPGENMQMPFNMTTFADILATAFNNNRAESRMDKLPEINLPKFNGEADQWLNFKDLFESVVDRNTRLSDVQKLHYLKMYVTGPAAQVIKHLKLGGRSYDMAWELLTRRYDNNKVLINTLLSKFVNLKPVRCEKPDELRALLDQVREINYSLAALGEEIGNAMVVFSVAGKLPTETHSLWEHGCGNSTNIPQFRELDEFIERRIRTLVALEMKSSSGQQTTSSANIYRGWQGGPYRLSGRNPAERTSFTHVSAYRSPAIKCEFCSGEHLLYQCKQFGNRTVIDRIKFIQTKQLCLRCFRHHSIEECKFTWNCHVCQGAHNTKLHQDNPQMISAVGTCEETPGVLLGTSKIYLNSNAGVDISVKSLLDPGSMNNFISERVVKLLNLNRRNCTTQINGIGGKKTQPRGMTDISFSSVYDRKRVFTISCVILSKITGTLPSIDKKFHDQFVHLNLADNEFYEGGQVDLLLGAGITSKLMLPELVQGELLAQNTLLGWVVSGEYNTVNRSGQRSIACIGVESPVPEDKVLQKFWETEEKIVSRNEFSKEENACELFYQATTTKSSDGRYVCRLPFRQDSELGRSRLTAIRYQEQLEKKFERLPEYKKRYVDAMNDYIQSGHAIECPVIDPNRISYYMPHLAVISESSLSTKTRIVFNASSPSSNKKSLNDVIMVGPTIQRDLVDKVVSFRLNDYVFTCDIMKMYRQIRIHEDDWQCQLFVWRNNPNEELKTYCLTTVTFGTASAPFTAIRTLKQLAMDQKETFPIACSIITEDCYVDDLHFGANTISGAKEGVDQLIAALKTAAFEVRKFASNEPSILDGLPDDHKDQFDTHKFMGLTWNSKVDTLSIAEFEFTDTKDLLTKRILLTNIAKIFDPLGWLQPIVVPAKLLLQDLFRAKLKWDDEVPDNLLERWIEIKKSFTNLAFAAVPRCFQLIPGEKIEVHGFSDASQQAYGAVVYIKTHSDVHFVIAKSRVAQIKPMTIPRLELKAALLLAYIMKKVLDLLETKGIKPSFVAWSDSKVVLSWITGAAEKWKPFVRNRVATIQEIIPADNWRYVASEDNPADVISRGCSVETYQELQFWKSGPEWLKSVGLNDNVKLVLNFSEEEKVVMEKKITSPITLVAINGEDEGIRALINKVSRLHKCCRVVAIILRWAKRGKEKKEVGRAALSTLSPVNNPLSADEINRAELIIWKALQQAHFCQEITTLIDKGMVNMNSSLKKLNPFLGPDKELRVGGRLGQSTLPYDQKHPIIIPAKVPIVDSLIECAHKAVLHGGVQLTLAQIRKKYWIIRGGQQVKAVLTRCVSCHRANPRTLIQLMGGLPPPRTEFSKAFLHTGVDFAGPFLFRISPGRGVRTTKGYIAIFICLAVKAIHLEVVSSLSTDAFLAALTRFSSRRGTVTHLYSDNGTNFVGAFRKLSKLSEGLEKMSLEWSFNPPLAPHFGGLWEAGVKSVKTHLRRTFGNISFTFEEMQTVMCRIEMCLNARPLCPLSDDPESLDALTPQHFLTGQSYIPIHDEDNSVTGNNLVRRWEMCKALAQDLCCRYQAEYLSRLQQRPKWFKENANLVKGQLVLVKDEGLHSTSWPLGRVEEVHPGSDGLVRVVRVKTKAGTKTRAVTHLSPLPIQTQKDTSIVIPTHPRRSPRLNASTVMMGIMFLFFVFGAVGGQVISLFNNEPGVHFIQESSKQIIVDHVQIQVNQNWSHIKEKSLELEQSLNKMESWCKSLSWCKIKFDDRKEQVLSLKSSVLEMSESKIRIKRGIPVVLAIVAGIAASVGSVVYYTESRLAKFDNNLYEIQQRQQGLVQLVDGQMDLFNKTVMVASQLSKESVVVKDRSMIFWNETHTAIQTIKTHFEMEETLTVIDEVVKQLEDIINIVHNCESMSPVFPDLVRALELEKINYTIYLAKRSLKNGTTIPYSPFFNDLVERATCKTNSDALSISFQIPVVTEMFVDVVRPVNVPVVHGDVFVWIDEELPLLAIEPDTNKILPLDNCRAIGDKEMCDIHPTLWTDCIQDAFHHSNLSRSCVLKTTSQADFWTEILPGEYIFTVVTNRTIQFEDKIFYLQGTGLLSTIKETEPGVILNTSWHLIKTPEFNLSVEIQQNPFQFSSGVKTTLSDLTNQMRQLQNERARLGTSTQWIPHTIMLNVIAALLAIILVILIIICMRLRNNGKRSRDERIREIHDSFFSNI